MIDMHEPIIVTIYGNVSSGKSPWANKIKESAIKKGFNVFFYDHHLFSFTKSFELELKKVKAIIKKENPDLGVIVIGTGNDRSSFRIEIEPFGYSAIAVMELLSGNDPVCLVPNAEPTVPSQN